MEGREEKKLRNRKKRKIQEEGSGFPRRSERLRLKETGGGQSRGQLKGAMLVLGLLSVLVPQSKESKVDNADYEVLQGLLKGMAAGVEFAESVAVSVELLKIREASQGRNQAVRLDVQGHRRCATQGGTRKKCPDGVGRDTAQLHNDSG